MNKKHTIIISCVLAMGIVVSGLAFAGGKGAYGRRGGGLPGAHNDFALILLARYQQKNLMLQTLSEMSKQPVEAITAKLKDQRMRTVMQELGIDRHAFATAMRIKAIERIQTSAESGTITPEQAKDILEKMDHRSQRRELMSQLVENGIKDGTITQEQAGLLLRKYR
jgi:hypothetical protein